MWEAALRRCGGSGWTRAMTSSGAPAAPMVGGRLTAGWATGKELTEPGGGRTPRVGRSLGEVPSAAPGGL